MSFKLKVTIDDVSKSVARTIVEDAMHSYYMKYVDAEENEDLAELKTDEMSSFFHPIYQELFEDNMGDIHNLQRIYDK